MSQEQTSQKETPKQLGGYSKISMVSGRELRSRARIPKEKRLEAIRTYYGLKPLSELALYAGCTVRTISNDIREWKRSGEYEEQQDEQWEAYMKGNKINDYEKFRALTLLKVKRMTNNQNVNVSVDDKKTDQRRVEEALKQYAVVFKTQGV